MYYLKGDLVTDGEILRNKCIEIVGKKINYIGNEIREDSYPVYEVKKGFICPGLIDIHIHAISGHDFMDGDLSFTKITEKLPQYGVTSLLATSRTGSLEDVMSLLQFAKDHMRESSSGSEVLGVHLEGPWINPEFSGAQPEKYIRKLNWNDIRKIIDPYKEVISLITLAPEEITDLKIINYLTSLGINVSAGHTGATIEEISKSMNHGLTSMTHTFNAMSKVDHREPGTAAAALFYDELACEVIADGLHVHPRMIELLYKVKDKDKMILISDCTGYDHLDDGKYYIRGKNIVKNGNKVTLSNGRLAGSTITLDKSIKYAVKNCNIPLEDAVYMATQSPLNALGHNSLKKGRLREGYEADLVIFDEDLDVARTIIAGKLVYRF